LQLLVPPANPAGGPAAAAAAAPTTAPASAPGSNAAVPATSALAATIPMLAALPQLAPRLPAAGQKARAAASAGSADALALAQLAATCARDGRLLAVVAADALAAQRLADELPWFAPGLVVALLPDWETLPYDHFSPHADLVSQRLATLHHVSHGECDVLVVAATTALYRLAPPEYLAAFTFFLKKGTRLDVDALRAQMALAGYQQQAARTGVDREAVSQRPEQVYDVACLSLGQPFSAGAGNAVQEGDAAPLDLVDG
jgi:hypothetical protein